MLCTLLSLEHACAQSASVALREGVRLTNQRSKAVSSTRRQRPSPWLAGSATAAAAASGLGEVKASILSSSLVAAWLQSS